MAFTRLNWQHVKDTFMEVDKVFNTVYTTMIGSKEGSSESTSSSSEFTASSDIVVSAGVGDKMVMLKRKSTEEDEEDGTKAKKACTSSEESGSDSEDRGAMRFLTSLTNAMIKPAQFLRKTPTFTGIDEWVPKNMEELAEFPPESVQKYKKVHPNYAAPAKFQLQNGEFAVLASPETLSKEITSPPHRKTHQHEKSAEEKLMKNELNESEKTKEKAKDKNPEEGKSNKTLYHLAILLYNEKKEKHVISMFRSHKLADVVGLCERCRENPELFRDFPKDVDMKDYLHVIFNELRENMTWKTVHISSKLGLIEYFKNLHEKKPHKLEKTLKMVVQPEGLTPLMIAIQSDQIETVRWMLEHDVDINCVTSEGANVLHVAATSSGDMLKMLWETKKCATMLNKSDAGGNSPTYIALSTGCFSNCSTLRGFGGTINSSDATHDATPVIGAMKRGKLDETTLRKILEVKKEGLEEVEPTTGNSVIHCATTKKSLIMLMEKFRDKTNPEARNAFEQTPLHVFVVKDELGLVMTICAYGVDINAQDANGNTPLHAAVTRGNVEIARMLLCLGARVDIKNRYRETARHISARLSDKAAKMDLVRSLIICQAEACAAGFIGCAFGCMHNEGLGACRAQMGSSAELCNNAENGATDGDKGAAPAPCSAANSTASSEQEHCLEEKVNDLHPNEHAATAAYEFVLDPDTQLVEEAYAERNETRAFPHDQAMERVKSKLRELAEQKKSGESNLINVLGLDGGGIRGLVTVQMLISLEMYLDRPLIDYFDWIGATSTGCYIMSTLMTGGSLRNAQRYYLQFKDQLFDSWTRPYDTKTLEGFIQRSFGAERKMGDIKYPRFFCTTVRADTFPVQLDLARNYRLPISDKENEDLGFTNPNDLTMWKAVRRSSAAPTYFSASEGKYIDGGMISNNPTLDLMAEICFWNTTCQKQKLPDKMVDVGCVLSVGTGVTPICPVDPSVFEMNDWMGLLRGIKNLSLVVIDQATATEGAPITRSRSWCHSLGTPYFRLNAPIFKDVILDTNDDSELAKIMWDSMVYSHTHRKDFQEVAELLKAVGTVEQRKLRFPIDN